MNTTKNPLTETGTLPYGVQAHDALHRDFELRLPTVGDNIDSVDEVGGVNVVALNAAVLARQIIRLGQLKPEEITFELIRGMHPADYNYLDAAAQALEKKLQAAAAAKSTSSASDLPLSAQG